VHRYVAAVSSNAVGVPVKEKRAQEAAEKAKKVRGSLFGGGGGWGAETAAAAAAAA
jgi:hypothetical protein